MIYRPKGDGPFPALVCVHGGAWVSGDRFATAGFAELVAEKGIVVMAIDTRLAPACPYPASVADVNYATRWLKYHSGRYKVDPDRVGGLGISSGGQLLLLSAMRYNDPRYMIHELQASGKELDARLAFVITCSGVLDPLARYRMAEESSNMAIVLCHRAYFGDEKTMEESSPLLILKRGEKTALPDGASSFRAKPIRRLPLPIRPKTWPTHGNQPEATRGPLSIREQAIRSEAGTNAIFPTCSSGYPLFVTRLPTKCHRIPSLYIFHENHLHHHE